MYEDERSSKVRLDGEEIVFDDGGYYIDLSRCRTPEEIVGWTLQIAGKSWASAEIIHQFILLALQANNIKRPILR